VNWVADVRAEALRPTIRKLQKAGFVSIKAIARELNERGIPMARGGKWRLTTVYPTAGAPPKTRSFQAQSRHPDE